MIGRSSVLLCCIALLWFQPCSSFLPYLRPLHHLRKAYISNSRELRMHATLAADAAVLSPDKLPSLQAQTATFSLLSTKIDFNEAIEEVVSKAITALNEQNSDDKIDAVVFQVSTAYETTIIDYQVIGNELRKAFPALQHIIGSTTSCPIAPLEVFQLPIEQESRHGIAMQFYSFKKHNIDVTSFRWTSAQVQEYIHNPSKTLFTPPLPGNNAIAMVVAPQMIKRNISALCSSLYQREGLTLFGSIPSAVNMLQAPKTFYMNSSFGLDESTDDLVGLKFEGDVDFATYVANSIKAVGPLFEVAKFEGNTVLTIKDKEGVEMSPMEFLDQVIKSLPGEEAFNLKKELIISIVTGKDASHETLLGQKPTSFNPLAGSVTIPELKVSPNLSTPSYLQFCVKDSTFARKNLERTTQQLRTNLFQYSKSPYAMFLLGNVDRGSNVFRIHNWETTQVYNSIVSSKQQLSIPMGGSFGTGAIVSTESNQESATITETDSVYVLLKAKSATLLPVKDIDKVPTHFKEHWLVAPDEVLSPEERLLHNDELDENLVEKKDPDSAHAVKVANMDYSVPEKMPKATNYLESLVWDREKDADRLRERYAPARAITMAKAADKTFPRRNFIARLQEIPNKPALIVDLPKTSIYNGNYGCDVLDQVVAEKLIGRLAVDVAQSFPNDLLAVSCNVDMSTFKGVFEDIEIAKRMTTVPIMCNDFTVFAYQLFRAKAHGSDAIRIYAPSIPAKDISYLIKTAKALGMTAVVVVASKPQLLNCLRDVQGLEVLSVTSRNLRLWKIDEGKASRILRDPEVKEALAARQAISKLYIMQEGFTSTQDVQEAKANGVDIIALGEELLHLQSRKVDQQVDNMIISDTVNTFMSPL